MRILGLSSAKNIFSLLITIVLVFFIGYLNFVIIRNQFVGEFSQNMGSIEISYIQMAKFWVESGGAGWQPLWYLGYPWHVFYTPLLPFLEVVLHIVSGFSFGHAYRVITAVGYILVPVTTFLFVWQISKSRTGAFVAGLFYTFVPSLIALAFGQVAQDNLSGSLEPRRFAILVRWGEGPHTLALAFLPLFGVFLSKYFESGKLRDLFLASLFLGLVAMTNAIAVWAAFLLSLSFLLAEVSGSKSDLIEVVKKIAKVGFVTFGLIGFWYNLPFLGTFFREGGGALSNWTMLFPWTFVAIFAIGVVIFGVISKLTRNLPGLAFALYWFIGFFLIVYIYYASGEDRLEYVPQALRLNTEVDLALGILIGVVISNGFLYFRAKIGKVKILSTIAAFAIVLVPIVLMIPKARQLIVDLPLHALPLEMSNIGSIERTKEYKVAKTLKGMVEGTDQRVFVPGNYGFWLNYFEPIPQIRGALFQSSTHFWPDHVYWQVTNGLDGQIALAWLSIANIGELVYGSELFGDYKVPKDKFEAILEPKLTNEYGDIFYSVPLKNDSLAKAVDYKALLAIAKPTNAIDEKPIFDYVSQLERNSGQKLKVEKVSNSHLKISGKLKNGQGILVQQTYDSGWHASKWKVKRDNFDFMVLVPEASKFPGDEFAAFVVDLKYSKPPAVYLGYLITLITIGFLIRESIKKWKQGKQDRVIVNTPAS